MADLVILWVVTFNVLVVSPSPICHLLIRSDGLTSECLYLDVKVLWEGKSWRRPSKTSSSISVILVASETLALVILAYDTSLVVIKYVPCTVSHSSGSISVSWTFLYNASTRISALAVNKYSSSLLCEPFENQTEWGSYSCGYVRNICGLYPNCFFVGD